MYVNANNPATVRRRHVAKSPLHHFEMKEALNGGGDKQRGIKTPVKRMARLHNSACFPLIPSVGHDRPIFSFMPRPKGPGGGICFHYSMSYASVLAVVERNIARVAYRTSRVAQHLSSL